MATVGQTLPQPESGWKRYDDTVGLIGYTGTWGTDVNTGYFGGTYRASNIIDNKIQICFLGTKFRIIADYFTNKPKVVSIIVDGVESTYGQYSTSAVQKALVFEKTGLNREYHTITITVKEPTVWTSFDAIDIDDDGELVRYDYLVSNWSEPMKKYGVAWFGFDETSGNVYDKLGLNNYVGTVTGATRTQGWNGEGNAIQSSGINQYVVFNNSIVPKNDFTIRFKIKALPNTNFNYFLGTAQMGTLNATDYGFTIASNPDGGIRYVECVTNATIINCTIDVFNVLDGKWHEIIVSRNNQLVTIYLDDKIAGRVKSTAVLTANNPLGLLNSTAYYSTAGRWLNGQIDDLQIYNKALSPSDFTQKRLVVKTADNKNLALSPTSNRIKEIPNTIENTLLSQGGVIKEINSAVDRTPIDLTRATTEYEIINNSNSVLGTGKVFTVPISTNFKTIVIEDNY